MPPSFLKSDPRFQDPLSQSVLAGGPMAMQPQTTNPSTNAFGLNNGAPSGFTMPNRPTMAPQSMPSSGGASPAPARPARPAFEALATNFANRTQATDPFAAVPLNPAFAYGLPGGPTNATVSPPQPAPPPAAAPATPPLTGNPFIDRGPAGVIAGGILADPAYTRWEPWMGTGRDFGTTVPKEWRDKRYDAWFSESRRDDEGD